MKKLCLILCCIAATNYVAGQRPVHDESKLYQFRAMETGPWKFKPDWYYYRWVYKTVLGVKIKMPGLGLHQNYINKHSPNIGLRSATLSSTAVEVENYKKQLEDTESRRDRELSLQADRAIDLADPIMKDKITASKNRFISNMTSYIGMSAGNDVDRQAYLYNEYGRIMDNLKIIKDSYLENSKRQEAYTKIANELDNLNGCVVTLIRFAYNKKENKDFFTNKKQ